MKPLFCLLCLGLALGLHAADLQPGDWDGVTQTAELQGPYEDLLQQQVPFTGASGGRSYFLTPWRAYMDTWPAARYLACLGTNYNVRDPKAFVPVAQVMAEVGLRSARVEIGWGHFSYNDPNVLQEVRFVSRLQALKQAGIRPLILLNCNAGAPCPIRGQRFKLTKAAEKGTREIFLEKTDGVVVGNTGFRGMAYQAGFPLITAVDAATGRCELSAPLPKPLPEGNVDLVTLKFRPFAGTAFADGTPNPAARETLDGFMAYVARVCQLVKEALGTEGAPDAGFDIEVWNEYTFGSQFLDDKNYYDPPRKFKDPLSYTNHGQTRTGHEIILPMTIDYVNDPANKLPGVNVISGFSNQRPWDNGTDMWPGQAGFSRHYYTSISHGEWRSLHGRLSPETEQNTKSVPLNALGKLDGEPGKFFIPHLTVSMPEVWQYAYKTELMTRELQPFPNPWPKHGRFSHPGTGRPAQVWMTEFNLGRDPWVDELLEQTQCAKDDPRLHALANAVAAKATLRSFVFHAHKGIHTINLFAIDGSDLSLGMLPDTFLPTLKEEQYQLTEKARAQLGPQLTVLGRVTKLMKSGDPLVHTRPLSVAKLVEHQPRLVFAGDGTPEHPSRWHRDDFACLPYQLAAGRYAVGYYVVTRDICHTWRPERDLLDPARYDMPEQTFDLTLNNVRGRQAKCMALDPITGTETPVKVLAATASTLTVALPTVDYPRFLLIEEEQPGPLVLNPTLVRAADGTAKLTFAANIAGTATVTWGAFPARNGSGETQLTLQPGVTATVALPDAKADDAVQLTLQSGDLTTRWPRWPHDVQGVLKFAPEEKK